MCGIFYTFQSSYSDDKLIEEGNKIQHRGPDNTSILKSGKHFFRGA